jgi:hypothetical protein
MSGISRRFSGDSKEGEEEAKDERRTGTSTA